MVVVVMALGIAANTSVFTILDAVVLADLPYRAPDRLVTFSTARDGEAPQDEIGVPAVGDWAAHSETVEALAVWQDAALRMTRDGRTELVRGMRVSASYFDLLGVPMQLGRGFRAEDDTPAGRSALILTDATWRTLFGGDPRVIGRAVQSVDGVYRIVGVLPADFRPLHMSNPGEFPRVFAPLGLVTSTYPCRPCPALRVVGRLRRGV